MLSILVRVGLEVFVKSRAIPELLQGMLETNREHYVSLEQVADHNDASEKVYDANDPGEGSFQIFEDYANKCI